MTQSETKTDFNQMSDKELITDYWTKRAPAFKKQRQAELKSEKMLQWQTEICSRLPQKSGLSILDIGCGAGFFSILLAEKGHNVTGIDLTESMIEEARKLGQETGSAASFLVMDAERLAFADNMFDAVVSRNVTWNLPHPEQAYAEWLRVLKPGGILLNYDAEYSRYYHGDFEKDAVYAHKDLTKEMVDECLRIYRVMDISSYRRPSWDLEVLRKLGASSCWADVTVGPRLYTKKDRFYAPAPFFGVFAVKETMIK